MFWLQPRRSAACAPMAGLSAQAAATPPDLGPAPETTYRMQINRQDHQTQGNHPEAENRQKSETPANDQQNTQNDSSRPIAGKLDASVAEQNGCHLLLPMPEARNLLCCGAMDPRKRLPREIGARCLLRKYETIFVLGFHVQNISAIRPSIDSGFSPRRCSPVAQW